VAGDGTSFGGYRVNEKLGFLPSRSDAVGRTTGVTGTMTVSGVSVTAASFSADLTKLSSDQQRRDNYIRSHAIDSDSFPAATFKLTSPVSLASIPARGTSVSASAAGSFTLHGVTRDVTIALQGQRTCSGLEIVGSLAVSFADYNIDPPNIGGLVSVDDHGTMELKLEMVRAA
jgi:polyisoprenoid-binding protein YceI